MKNRSVGVQLTPKQIDEIDHVARRYGMSRSRAVSTALVLGIPLMNAGHGMDPTRIVGHLEYIQAALDLFLERTHPDLHGQLPEITIARIEQYHG